MFRGRHFNLLRWSFLPERISISVNASGRTRWLRIGLLPGTGRFKTDIKLYNFCSFILIKPPEARTYYLEKIPLIKLGKHEDNEGNLIL